MGCEVLLLLLLCAAVQGAPLGSEAQPASSNSTLLCSPVSPHLIVYNRVPKCASSSMLALLGRLEEDGELTWVHSKEYTNRVWWSDEEEVKVAKNIMHRAMLARELQRSKRRDVLPVVYDQHMRYVDFSHALYSLEAHYLFGNIPPTLPGPSPTPPTTPLLAYINVVREPVDRAVSSYYYALSDNRRKEKIKDVLERRGSESNLTVDECLSQPEDTRRCGFRGDGNLMTAFFCGHRGACRCVGPGSQPCSDDERRRALQLAKLHMDQYTLVGLQSRLEDTMELLSLLLPPFSQMADFKAPRERRTRYPAPSAHARELLSAWVSLDLELYEHAVALFERRFDACLSAKNKET